MLRSRPRLGPFTLVLSIVIGVSCVGEPDPRPTRKAQIEAARSLRNPASDREVRERRAAMLSVYSHALLGQAEFMGKETIPLARAREILERNAQRHPADRIRLAIATYRLALGGLRVDRTSLEPRFESRIEQDFLRELSPNPVQDLLRVARGAIAVVRVQTLPDQIDWNEWIGLVREAMEMGTWGITASFLSVEGASACPYSPSAIDTQIAEDNSLAPNLCGHTDANWYDGMVWAKSTFTLQRPLADLAAVLDPQSWDASDEHNAYFEEACAWNGNQCMACPHHEVGSGWNDSFFEWFQVVWNPLSAGGDALFQNELKVTNTRTTSSFNSQFCMEYVFAAKIGTEACRTSNNATAECIDVDDGFTNITTDSTGLSTIKVEKMLHYTDWENASTDTILNANASVLLTKLGDETLVQACCPVPEVKTCVPNTGLGPPGTPVLID